MDSTKQITELAAEITKLANAKRNFRKSAVPIDDDVPPPGRQIHHEAQKYPVCDLEVGQSFFLAGDKAHQKLSGAVGNYKLREGKHSKRRFTVRKLTENGVLGSRCWRLSDAEGIDV